MCFLGGDVPREQRRLAAIVSADVAGYSRLMGRDESGTLARLREHRKQRFEPIVDRFGGRIVKLTGDGALVEFASAVDALGSAITFQQAVADANHGQPPDTAIIFRIGLHLGDVIVEEDDLYGDGVNVAARLEAEAEPGGIVISGAVKELVSGRLKAGFGDMGERVLKNIERTVPAYSVAWTAADWPNTEAEPRAPPEPVSPSRPLPLPDKPSIAVLPFQNMSGDPEQEYFADGVAEDIITALSKFRWFFVSARNSTFAYKGKAVDIKRVGEELGVRYVLEGSVRKAGARVRVTAQLIEAAGGNHIWAERYDRDLVDIFELQDDIERAIVTAVEPELSSAEFERVSRKVPSSLAAWDLLQQAMWHMNQRTIDDLLVAAPLFEKAATMDPSLARAYSGHARLLVNQVGYGWSEQPAAELQEAKTLAREAIRRDDRDPFNHDTMGRVHAFLLESEDAIRAHRIALTINPNVGYSHWALAEALWTAGRSGEALSHVEEAIRLSPRDPATFLFLCLRGSCLEGVGRLEDAEVSLREGLRLKPNVTVSCCWIVDFYVRHERLEEARTIIAAAVEQNPDFDCSFVRKSLNPLTLLRGDDLIANLKRAGLPE